ncbi:hypothetical protein B296_00022584, partial [Ensete ventricosum]
MDPEFQFDGASSDEGAGVEERAAQSPWEFASYSESVAEEHARRNTTSIDAKITRALQERAVSLPDDGDGEEVEEEEPEPEPGDEVLSGDELGKQAKFALPSGKIPYRSVRTGPIADWYADRSLLGGTAKIDRRRSIEGEKGKKKRRRRKNKRIHTSFPRAVLACASSLPTRCPHPRVARASSSPTGDSSPVQGDRTSPHARRKISE